MPVFNLSIFLLGCAGGLLPDVLRLVKCRYERKPPEYLKYVQFWISLGLGVLIGGLVAWILSAETAKDALIYGFAAPEILTELVGAVTQPPPTEAERAIKKPFQILAWWR